jgi:phage terminase large subunit-like protein
MTLFTTTVMDSTNHFCKTEFDRAGALESESTHNSAQAVANVVSYTLACQPVATLVQRDDKQVGVSLVVNTFLFEEEPHSEAATGWQPNTIHFMFLGLNPPHAFVAPQ